MVQLQTKEGDIHDVDRDVAEMSAIIKHMLEDLGDQCDDQPIPLENITAEVMKKIIAWAEHHRHDPKETVAEHEDDYIRPRSSAVTSEWDRSFMDMDKELIFELIRAANYLDMKPLLELGCKTVANMIKGKTTQQIRDLFGLVNDFTPEEEEQIRREMAWADDI